MARMQDKDPTKISVQGSSAPMQGSVVFKLSMMKIAERMEVDSRCMKVGGIVFGLSSRSTSHMPMITWQSGRLYACCRKLGLLLRSISIFLITRRAHSKCPMFLRSLTAVVHM